MSARFACSPLPLRGLVHVQRQPLQDARGLFERTHVTVLPGRYLARHAHGENPGAGCVRIALVPGIEDCVEAARRIVEFCR